LDGGPHPHAQQVLKGSHCTFGSHPLGSLQVSGERITAPAEPDVRLSPHPALQSRRWYYDATASFPCGTTVASRAKPLSMPPVVTGAVLSSLLLFLAVLHHVQAITAWRWATTPPVPSFPHAGIVASSDEARWYRTSQVPWRTTYRGPLRCLL
jgi:hypothetical protein